MIGDVSGKGIPAAMTVSLLVGTFRTLAHYTAPAMREQRVTARCRCKPAADRGLLDIARAARAFVSSMIWLSLKPLRPYLVERRSAIRPKGHFDWHGPQRRQLFVQWTIWFVRVRKPHRC